MRRTVFIALVIAGALQVPLAAQAAERTGAYPQRPVRFIVPFVAGGSYDIIARLVGKGLFEALGQQFVVDNRPGAGGLIGTELVAKAAPDGYTMGMFGNPQTILVNVNPRATFDVEKDFTPISALAVLSNVLVIHPSVPAKSLKEFIALAKARPRQLNYGSGGVGGTSHLAGELFKSTAGVDIVHVPYKGAGVAITELLSGQLQFMAVNMVVALPHVKSGKLRALAVASAKRSPFMPDVPAADEAGLPGYEFNQWYGVVGPARLAKDIVGRLHREIDRIVRSPDFRENLSRQGAEPLMLDAGAFASFIKADLAKYAKIVKEGNIRAE